MQTQPETQTTIYTVDKIRQLRKICTDNQIDFRNAPEHLICSITDDLMIHPVIAEDNKTYELAEIKCWVENNHTSPLTQEAIECNFVINKNYVGQIIRYLENRLMQAGIEVPLTEIANDAASIELIKPSSTTPDFDASVSSASISSNYPSLSMPSSYSSGTTSKLSSTTSTSTSTYSSTSSSSMSLLAKDKDKPQTPNISTSSSAGFRGNSDAMQRLKMTLIGDHECKSNLMRQLIPYSENRFIPGVDFIITNVGLYKIFLWDTAGQDRLKTITYNYVKDAHALIFCVTAAKLLCESGEIGIITWLENIIIKFADKIDGQNAQTILLVTESNEALTTASKKDIAALNQKLTTLVNTYHLNTCIFCDSSDNDIHGITIEDTDRIMAKIVTLIQAGESANKKEKSILPVKPMPNGTTNSTNDTLFSNTISYISGWLPLFWKPSTTTTSSVPKILELIFIGKARSKSTILTKPMLDDTRIKTYDIPVQPNYTSHDLIIKKANAIIFCVDLTEMLLAGDHYFQSLDDEFANFKIYPDIPKILLITHSEDLLTNPDKIAALNDKLTRLTSTYNLETPIFCGTVNADINGIAIVDAKQITPKLLAIIQIWDDTHEKERSLSSQLQP